MFKGSIPALVTPFTDDNTVDYATLKELIEWHIEASSDALVICGTTGEAPTLFYEEQVRIFKESVMVSKKRIPIIAGTGSNCTQHAVELTLEAKTAGCDAALVITPYYNRSTPEGCFQHYQEISKVGIPFILYHHPGRTGVKLPVKALARIAELPNVVGIKDGTGDLDYIIELMQETRTPIFSGDDTLALPMMATGTVGIISIVANIIPREWKVLCSLLLADQIDEAREFFYQYYPIAKAMVLENNPQCIKFAMESAGKCSGKMRLPLVDPTDTSKLQILNAISKIPYLQTPSNTHFNSAGLSTSELKWV